MNYENDKYHPIIRSYRLKKECQNPDFYKLVAIYCPNKTIYKIADNLNIYLETNYISNFLIKSIFDLNITNRQSFSIETIYTLFLQNVCIEIAQIEKSRIIELIESFWSDRYNHKQFIKLSLFLFAKTWNITKSLFFRLIDQQGGELFSESFWKDDFYFMLDDISIHLDKNESIIIKSLIEEYSDINHNYKSPEHFKLYWFSSLNKSKHFKKNYEELSLELGKTKQQIKPKLERNVTFGSTSPLSKNEILTIPVEDLISVLKKFDPKRGFREPCVDGLGRALQETIKENPSLFSINWEKFLEVPYGHIHEIYFGLTDAWNNKLEIDWISCIKFIDIYTSQNIFGTVELEFKNSPYKYDHFSALRSFCRLLSSGMRDDNKSFDSDLLPLVEKIIFRLIGEYLKNKISDNQIGKLGSASFVINSDNGILIGTLFDYSLRKARLKSIKGKKKTRWDAKEKELFEELISLQIHELYTYLGWHRNQFYFLDYEWTQKQLETICTLDEQTIKSYFGGHILTIPYSKFEYKAFKNIYVQAINHNWQVEDSTMGEMPIEFHAVIFYIFNFEDLNDGDVITQIFESNEIKKIRGAIHSLSFKFDKYIEDSSEIQKIKFRQKIFKIWNHTLSTLEQVNDLKAKEIPGIFYLIKYIDELDEESFQLINRSSRFARNTRDLDKLIENLNRLKTKGNIFQSCVYACKIFIDSVFTDIYYASIMQKEIIEFTEYMYNLNNVELTDYSNKICNEFAKKGEYFLRELYEKYNN